MTFYFTQFEHRRPPPPLPNSLVREKIWQILGVASLALGAWYIHWRWTQSLNWDALWFAVPLLLAESCAYFGLILFTLNLWKVKDFPILPPPEGINQCVTYPDGLDRPVAVDVFIATYNEDEELVRLSIRDANPDYS